MTFLFSCLKCKSFDNNITTLNRKWTFASLLTVYSSSFWPLQCQCLLFIKSGRFITRRLANNGTHSGKKLSNYATRRGSGFNFVILVSTKIILLIKKKECVMLGWSKSRWIWIRNQYAKYRDIWHNYHLWYFKIVSIVSQFWNNTRAIYANYHYKSCYYLYLYSRFSIFRGLIQLKGNKN